MIRRLLCCFCILALVGVWPAASASAFRLGDVNADGRINAADALCCLQQSGRLTRLDETALAAADVNVDGTVNGTDAEAICQYAVGMLERLPGQEPVASFTIYFVSYDGLTDQQRESLSGLSQLPCLQGEDAYRWDWVRLQAQYADVLNVLLTGRWTDPDACYTLRRQLLDMKNARPDVTQVLVYTETAIIRPYAGRIRLF